MKRLHFVYFNTISKWEQELKFSLRSLEKHIQADFEVSVIGEIPEYIDRKKVNCIEIDPEKVFIEEKVHPNIITGYYTSICTEEFDEFILIHDDHIFVKDVDYNFFERNFYIEVISDDFIFSPGKKDYFSEMMQITAQITKEKFGGVVLSHACNMPMKMDSEILKDVVRIYELGAKPVEVYTSYHNFIRNGLKIPKVYEHCESVRRGFIDTENHEELKIMDELANKLIFFNDRALNSTLKEYLEEQFPNHSSFEIECKG